MKNLNNHKCVKYAQPGVVQSFFIVFLGKDHNPNELSKKDEITLRFFRFETCLN